MLRALCGSYVYKKVRKYLIQQDQKMQISQHLKPDLERVVELGDSYLKRLLNSGFGCLFFNFSPSCETSKIKLYDLEFDSPLIYSSFKDDLSVIEMWLRLGIGGGLLKTIFMDPRKGNPRPRLLEVGDHLLNAMGLPGKGAAAVLNELKDSRVQSFDRPIGLSIGGNTPQDYIDVIGLCEHHLSDAKGDYFYELNISCPNTEEGQDVAKNPTLLDPLLEEIRTKTVRVLGVKFSPDFKDDLLHQLASVVTKHSRTYINIGNTTYRSCTQLGLEKQAISIGGGGYSGPSLYKRTLEMLKLLDGYGCPLVATGGVSKIDQVKELLASGATLVGMATALVKDPYCIPKINSKLS